MKNKFIMITFASLLALTSYAANAGTVSADYDKVSSISIGSTGTLYIFMEESEINPGMCASGGRYALAAANSQYNIIYAQVLTAMAAGYELKFAINDDSCLSTTSTQYPSVSRSAMRTPR